MLGPLQVRRADGTVVSDDQWRTHKTRELLRLLALHNGEPVPVRTVVELLWPGVDPARGRASLRTAASQLRKTLGDDCVGRHGGALVLLGAWVDVQAFEELLAEAGFRVQEGDLVATVAAVKQAEALWVGDLDLPDSPGDWVYDARERLHRLRCRALLDAADAAATLCWMPDSLELARRAEAVEPSERVARALMRALAGVGEVQKALAIFEQTRRELAAHYGVDPSPQTRALHVQLLSEATARTWRAGTVGHEVAIRALAGILEANRQPDRNGALVWLEGEPGSGRDSVARAACRTVGLCLHEPGRDTWQVDDLDLECELDGVPATKVVLLPPSYTVSSRLLDVLERLVRRRGGTIVVPVQRAPGAGPAADVQQHAVRVNALDDDELHQLAEMVLQGRPTADLLGRLRSASGGRSGAACHLARTWLGESRVVWSVGGLALADVSPAQLPAASLALRRRLRMMSPFARDVVDVLSVTADETDGDEVAAVVCELRPAATPGLVHAALAELVDAEHVFQGWRGFRMRDDAVRREIATWMRPTTRRRLCLSVAEHVSLPLPLRVDLLVAAGEHERAVRFGAAALELAQERGDLATSAALREALLDVPAQRGIAFDGDGSAAPGGVRPFGRDHAARAAQRRRVRPAWERMHGLAAVATLNIHAEPLAALLVV